jgi:WD40 repeat protein
MFMRHVQRGEAGQGCQWWAVGALLAALAAGAAAQSPPTAPILRIEAGMHSAAILRVDTDAEGRFAVTGGQDKTARVWEIASGRLLHVLRPPIGDGFAGQVSAVALSPDGTSIAAAGSSSFTAVQSHSVYLFDRATGRLVRRMPGLPNSVASLRFSKDGQWLAIGLYAKGGLRVWSLADPARTLIDSSYGDAVRGADWDAGGRLVTASADGKLRAYPPSAAWATASGAALQPEREVAVPSGDVPAEVAFSPDGRQLALSHLELRRIDVLDGKDFSLQFSPESAGTARVLNVLSALAWSRDGSTLAASGRMFANGRMQLRTWPRGGRGAPVDTPVGANSIFGLRALPNDKWLLGTMDPMWGVASPFTRGWLELGKSPTAQFLRVKDIPATDAQGLQVQFPFEPGGQAVHHFDLRQRRLVEGQPAQLLKPRTTGLPVQDWLDTEGRASFDGRAMGIPPNDVTRSLAIDATASSFALGSDFQLRLFDAKGQRRWIKAATSAVRGVNILPHGKVLVAAYGDGTLRWHRMSDGQELLALFAHADRKRWVLWTPTGYYDASPGAEDLIGWHLNRGPDEAADFFPAGRFRDRFYRPDVIDRVIDAVDESQAVRLADEARGLREAPAPVLTQVLPPVLELVSSSEVHARSANVAVRARARAAGDAPVTGWRLRVDGQNVADAKPAAGAAATSGAAGTEREFSVPVPARDSEIQVFAENRHGVSTPVTVRVRWAEPAAAPGAVPAAATTAAATPATMPATMPAGAPTAPAVAPAAAALPPTAKLYVLAVGVGRYQHADINGLDLPAKDASDFAAAMQRQQGRLYRQVEARVLTDAQATRDEIVDGLEWLSRQVTQHDVGMVFIAGHGVNDPAQGYIYLPVNADPDKLRRTGVPMDEFRKTLANLAGKALFFFDTCHSGNVLGQRSRAGPNDVRGVINELASAENGVVVFSSSTGRQLSYENKAWGNGAFTKALVEGLDGRADQQRSGRVTHKMLDVYVSERVKELTQGRQSPVTQAPGGVPDFPVALSR